MLRVARVVLVGVSLALKGEVGIALVAVTAIGQTEQPLNGIPQVEKDVEHLALLQGVYILVTGTDTIQRTFGENDAKEVDGIETLT